MLYSEQLSTANSVNHLSWLSPKFPRNVYCIVSSTNHPPTISRIQEYSYYSKELEALKTSDAQDIIRLFLQRFNKVRFKYVFVKKNEVSYFHDTDFQDNLFHFSAKLK